MVKRLALKSDGYTTRGEDSGLGGRPNSNVASRDRIRDGMEDVGTRTAEQIQWAGGALARVGERNQLALGGQSLSGESFARAGMGLQLIGVPREEIRRGDRQGSGRGHRRRKNQGNNGRR